MGTTMDENILKEIGLTDNETKVYLALLKLKKGTKTNIVREAKVLSSKVYEILDRLIRKGFVAYFVENGVKTFVPVHPNNVEFLFEEKIHDLEKQKITLDKYLKKFFSGKEEFLTDVQIFKGWRGFQQAILIILSDLKNRDIYHILGLNATEDIEGGFMYIPKVARKFDEKKITRKVILKSSDEDVLFKYLKEYGNRKLWDVKHFPTVGPLEIGISNNYILLNLLEKEPISIIIKNKNIRNSFLQYFNILWKISAKLKLS